MNSEVNLPSSRTNPTCGTDTQYPLRRATDVKVASSSLSASPAPFAREVAKKGRRNTDGTHTDLYEWRWQVLRYLLERDSAATILGALLLLSTFAFVICASVFEAVVPDPVSNAFLLLLGYFFGHARNANGGNDRSLSE